jgi:PAS domain S-box-containing protein
MNKILNRIFPPASNIVRKNAETRQRKMLNIMLWGTILGIALILASMLIFDFALPNPITYYGREALYIKLFVLLAELIGIALIDRFVSTMAASVAFNVVLFVTIILSDTPKAFLQGASLIFLILPVVTASFLIRPWASYIVAAIIGIGLSVTSVILNTGIPGIPAIALIFIIALIVQQSTSALERAIEQEQEKNRALAESEDRFKKIMETSVDAILVTELEGVVLDCNQAFVKAYGALSKEELLGIAGYQLLHPDEKLRYAEMDAQLHQQGNITDMEVKFLRKNGTVLIMNLSASLVSDQEGKRTVVICTFHDITERKRMENELRQSEERFRALIENSSDIVAILGTDNTIRYVSPSVERLLGYKTEELIGQKITDYLHPEDMDIAIAALTPGIPAEAIGPMVVLRLRNKRSSWSTLEVIGQSMYDHPAIEGTIVNCRSITGQKHAENELRKSNQLLESTLASIDDAVFVIDSETGKIAECNPAASEMFGYPRGEMLTRTPIFLYVSENARDEFVRQMELALEEKGVLSHFEYQMKRKDGTIFPIESSIRPLNGPDGKQFGWVSLVHDITDRKQAEEELRKSNQLLESTLASIDDAVFVFDATTSKITECNPAASEMFGYPRGDMLGRTPEFLHIDDNARQELIKELNLAVREKGRLSHFEFPMKRKDGTIFPTEHSVVPLNEPDGKQFGWVSVVHDITERKRAEDELRESNQLLEKTLASLKEAVFIIDWNTRLITDCNPAATDMFGYSREEFLGRSIDFLHVNADALAEFREHLYEEMGEKGFFNAFEFHMKRKDGTVFPTEHSVTVLFNEQGEQVSWVSVIRDITERRRMEDELRESEEKFSKAFQSNPAPMAISGMDGRYIEINEAFSRMLGYQQEDVYGRTPTEVGFFVDPGKNRRAVEILREQGQLQNYEMSVRTKSGEILHGLFFAEPLQLSDRPLMLTVMNDITQRKQAEDQLRESEEKYHRLIDLLPIGVGIHKNGRITLINPTGAKLMGANNQEEMLGKPMMDLIHPDYRELAKARIKNSLIKGTIAGQEEEKFIRMDGTAFDAQATALPFGTGNDASMLVVFDDITERKRVQEAIAFQNVRIQEVSRQLVEVQEREKRLLASELHDDLGQSLTSLKLMLELASGTRSSAERKQRLNTARDVVSDLMDKVRNLSLDLRPAMLDDFGLFAALRWLFERFQSQTGISVWCDYDLNSDRRFKSAVETAAFRIIQEALTNVARHAEVKDAQVSIEVGNELSIEIADQGSGFDNAEMVRKFTSSGGLSGMQERARLLGGQVDILSKKGAGTRVVAKIPLGEEKR